MIPREIYIRELFRYKDKQIIKVLTGIRRCGKSTLFEIFIDELIKIGVEEKQIVYINFEDLSTNDLREPKILYEYIIGKIDDIKKHYIFLDEIQNVIDFPKVLDSLFIRKQVDLYVTGSNAFLLSSELATLLSGRYIEIHMQPLSFREYVTFYSLEDNLESAYQGYLSEGSFPFTTEFNHDMKAIKEYLRGIYNTVILKDVITRNKITNPLIMESIIYFLFDNIGSIVSINKISNTLSSFGRSIDVKTVEKYINALCESFMVYKVKRYDVKGKQHLKTLEKYYVIDLGLRYVLLGKKGADIGHILENVVFLELKRRGYDIYLGKVENREIDFVVLTDNGTEYYQVAATLRSKEILERELAPLRMLSDSYPKYILTLDRDPSADYNGIRTINVLDWLMQ